MNHQRIPIWHISDKKEAKLLRSRLKDYDFSSQTKKEREELIARMRTTMVAENGIGLAANQVGLNMRVFVAQLPSPDGRGYKGKFYAVFNPTIVSISKKKEADIEGCLSVPGEYGAVERANKITISGYDKNQRPITISATGLLARIFQHETDHLDGKLFIDIALKPNT